MQLIGCTAGRKVKQPHGVDLRLLTPGWQTPCPYMAATTVTLTHDDGEVEVIGLCELHGEQADLFGFFD